jgi:hypothetical protein
MAARKPSELVVNDVEKTIARVSAAVRQILEKLCDVVANGQRDPANALIARP